MSTAKHVVLLGETHGTKETPQAAKQYFADADTVCLEIPSDQQPYIDEDRLEEAPFFNRPTDQEDGRSTKEYQQLIEELIDDGKRVVCVDINYTDEQEVRERDKRMAKNIAQAADKTTVALLGSMHSAKKPISFNGKTYKSAGSFLQEQHDELHTILLYASSGSFYNCGVKQVPKEQDHLLLEEYYDEVRDIGQVTPATPS